MPPITASTEVHRPAADVYAYATDPARFAEWQKGVVSGHMEAGNGSAQTARCVTVRRIGFAARASTSELVHADPPHTWRVRGIDGPIRAAVDVTVESVGEEKSRLTIVVDFVGHGIGRLLVPLVVRPEARKEMSANLAALRQRLENPA
jgi:carbon monoxide dehydrogenase subunit G